MSLYPGYWIRIQILGRPENKFNHRECLPIWETVDVLLNDNQLIERYVYAVLWDGILQRSMAAILKFKMKLSRLAYFPTKTQRGQFIGMSKCTCKHKNMFCAIWNRNQSTKSYLVLPGIERSIFLREETPRCRDAILFFVASDEVWLKLTLILALSCSKWIETSHNLTLRLFFFTSLHNMSSVITLTGVITPMNMHE